MSSNITLEIKTPELLELLEQAVEALSWAINARIEKDVISHRKRKFFIGRYFTEAEKRENVIEHLKDWSHKYFKRRLFLEKIDALTNITQEKVVVDLEYLQDIKYYINQKE